MATFLMVKILTKGLPKDVANMIYNEFEVRIRDVEFLVNNSTFHSQMAGDMRVVEALLSLSLFHRKIICNLNGVKGFYDQVDNYKKKSTISIGSYKLDRSESTRIWAIITRYNELREKYRIGNDLFEYTETKEFLNNLIRYKNSFGRRKRK